MVYSQFCIKIILFFQRMNVSRKKYFYKEQHTSYTVNSYQSLFAWTLFFLQNVTPNLHQALMKLFAIIRNLLERQSLLSQVITKIPWSKNKRKWLIGYLICCNLIWLMFFAIKQIISLRRSCIYWSEKSFK